MKIILYLGGKKLFKFKNIKNELMALFIPLIVIICIGIALISMFISKKAVVTTINTTLPEVAEQATTSVESSINTQLKVMELLAENEKLKNEDTPLEEKLAILSAEAKRSGHLKMTFVDVKGNSTTTLGEKASFVDRDYFKKAISGKSSVSDPVVSKVDGHLVVVYCVPIKNNGNVVGAITSVRSGDELSKYTNNVKFGKSGQAFMIKNDGTVIAHNNKDLVLKQDNDFENIKKDATLKSIVEIEKKMVAGESGAGEYAYKGNTKYAGYAPIKNTGWSIAIVVDSNEILSQINTLRISIAIASVIFIILGGIVVMLVSASITKPVKASMDFLKNIAEGDLTLEVSEELLHRQDELGQMGKSIDVMRNSIVNMLEDIKVSSVNIDSQAEKLTSASEEVACSSENVSIAINDVAKGTVGQAEDLVDITNILQNFSDKLKDMVSIISDVNLGTNNIKTMADCSNKDMSNVVKSVNNVNEAFKNLISKIESVGANVTKINEITNLINSISEKTNLLALNAAIEAARAGESGRGFSVVADEIRKLAEQSQESSVNISNLISEISKDTSVMVNTTDVMKDELKNQESNIYTAIKSFETITEAVDVITPKMASTNASVENLNNSKENILTKIETSSAIAEETSASSEEIAASTEEMNRSTEEISKSSQLLNDMSKKMMDNVNRFKL